MNPAICTVAAAAVRKEPSHRSEMINQLLFGDVVMIMERKEDWLLIKGTWDGYEGWTTHHLITPIDEAIAQPPLQYVGSSIINPVTLPNGLINAPMGCSLTAFDPETRLLWQDAYKYHGTYRSLQPGLTEELLRKLIQPWLQAPYLWGGRTYMGVDCSGLVQVLYKVMGIPLLRDAYQQATQGSTVALPDIKVGDVAFFHNEQGRIVHVGIMLSATQIVHAAGTVRIDRFTEKGILHSETGKQTHELSLIKRMH